ncbi:hypothetical protein HC823_00850 [Candidatus Gracilibacteria bacterium]|nr:hypothetical protein [Candidatus Gracilibacteria bacterium]
MVLANNDRIEHGCERFADGVGTDSGLESFFVVHFDNRSLGCVFDAGVDVGYSLDIWEQSRNLLCDLFEHGAILAFDFDFQCGTDRRAWGIFDEFYIRLKEPGFEIRGFFVDILLKTFSEYFHYFRGFFCSIFWRREIYADICQMRRLSKIGTFEKSIEIRDRWHSGERLYRGDFWVCEQLVCHPLCHFFCLRGVGSFWEIDRNEELFFVCGGKHFEMHELDHGKT